MALLAVGESPQLPHAACCVRAAKARWAVCARQYRLQGLAQPEGAGQVDPSVCGRRPEAVTSSVAAPQRMCQGLSTGLTTQTGTAVNASNNMPIFVEGAFGIAARAVTDTKHLPPRPGPASSALRMPYTQPVGTASLWPGSSGRPAEEYAP